MDDALASRLAEAGVDVREVTDPAAAWLSLQRRFGARATLLDRYALEAAARGIPVAELDEALKRRLTLEVLEARSPGFQILDGSNRQSTDPVEVVDYDPGWPGRFEAWRRRLAARLGPAALRIEHIGSTAVPGLAAKPVIDIQVSVADVEDEAAYVPAIEAAGVALRSRELGHRYFRPAGDKPREVQVHVCAAGSEWERVHVLFRDHLRADATARQAYGRLKFELARQHRHDRIAYNEAKTHFILGELERLSDRARQPRPGS